MRTNGTVRGDAAMKMEEFRRVARGHPGTLMLGQTLQSRGLMPMEDLGQLAQELGLHGKALYILHKEFGGKDAERTAEVLRLLRNEAAASFPRTRGGVRPVVAFCTTETRRHERL